jgi:hypothetical protein
VSKDLIFPPELDLETLAQKLGAKQGFWGKLTAVSTAGGQTLGTYERPRPAKGQRGIALKLRIGDTAPPANPPGETHMFDGESMVQGQKMKVATYRLTTDP